MRAESRNTSRGSKRGASRAGTVLGIQVNKMDQESVRSKFGESRAANGSPSLTNPDSPMAAEKPTTPMINIPLQLLSDEQKQAMIVEERYTLFQIENKLRQLCSESNQPLSRRITTEAELTRKVQQQAEAAKREVSRVGPQIEKALMANQAINKINGDIGALEQTIRLSEEKQTHFMDTIETNLHIFDMKMQNQTQMFSTEMSGMQDLRQATSIGVTQIQDYKQQLEQRVNETIEGYRMHVAELETPQKAMKIGMREIERKMEQLTDECNKREASEKSIHQRIDITVGLINDLRHTKIEKRELDKVEANSEWGLKDTKSRLLKLENSLRNTIDYTLRYQWKETRNIVNRAIARVTRPLILKDLFYANVIETNPELYIETQDLADLENNGQQSKALDSSATDQTNSVVAEQDKQLAPNIILSNQKSNDSAFSKPTTEHKSIISKQSALKIPNLLITDFKFSPNDEDNLKVHPILGTAEVRNIHEIDWQALKGRALQEWTDICQEHYEVIVKHGNEPPPEPSRLSIGRRSSVQEIKTQSIERVESIKHSQIRLSPGPELLRHFQASLALEGNRLKENSRQSKRYLGDVSVRSVSRASRGQRESHFAPPVAATEEQDIDEMLSNYSAQLSVPRQQSRQEKEIKEKKHIAKPKKKERKEKLQPQKVIVNNKIQVDDQTEIKAPSLEESHQSLIKLEQSILTESKIQSVKQQSVHRPPARERKERKPRYESKKKKDKKQNKRENKQVVEQVEDSMHQDSIQMPEKNVMLDDPVRAHQSQTREELNSKSQTQNSLHSEKKQSVKKEQRAKKEILNSQQEVVKVVKQQPQANTQSHEAPIDKVDAVDTVDSQGLTSPGSPAPELLSTPIQKKIKANPIAVAFVKVLNPKESIESSGAAVESDSDYDPALSSSDDDASESVDFEDGSESAEQDAADCEALGVDLMRFLKKSEFDFYHEKMREKIDMLESIIETQQMQIDKEIGVEKEQYSEGCSIIEKRIAEQMIPIKHDISKLIKSRARQHSDDQIAHQKVMERFHYIKKEFGELQQTVTYNICPIVCCLLEQQCVQLACEEQEDLDKLKIALYGHRDERQQQAEQASKVEKHTAKMQAETERKYKNSHAEKCSKNAPVTIDSIAHRANKKLQEETAAIIGSHSVDIPTVLKSPTAFEVQSYGLTKMSVQNDYSIFDATMKDSPAKDDFLRSIMESHYGETKERDSVIQPHKHDNNASTFNHQSLWQKRQPASEVLQFDQNCRTCVKDDHTAKLFKVACLAYVPSKINYRNQSFTKQQLLAIRKYLIGQTTQLIFQTPLMKVLNLSPKKIFDNIYLHVEDQARRNVNISVEAHKQYRLIENELSEATAIRSVLLKDQQAPISMLETSVNSYDQTQLISTSDEFVKPKSPGRQQQHTADSLANEQVSAQFSAEYHAYVPLTAREFHSRKRSIDTSQNSRNQATTTAAPQTSKRRPSVMNSSTNNDFDSVMSNQFRPAPGPSKMLHGKNLNLDINDGEFGRKANKQSVFLNKRYSQQPPPQTAGAVIRSPTGSQINPRAIFNQSCGPDPAISTLAKKHFKQSGCRQEQQKQYMNFMAQSQKTHEMMRAKLQSQPVPHSNNMRAMVEPQQQHKNLQKAILNVMPLQFNDKHDDIFYKQQDSMFLDTSPPNHNNKRKKSLPPLENSRANLN